MQAMSTVSHCHRSSSLPQLIGGSDDEGKLFQWSIPLNLRTQVGRDEADDEKRQRVLADWRDWLIKRC